MMIVDFVNAVTGETVAGNIRMEHLPRTGEDIDIASNTEDQPLCWVAQGWYEVVRVRHRVYNDALKPGECNRVTVSVRAVG